VPFGAIWYGRRVSFRFGDFVVDTVSYALLRAGQAVPVRPKVFDLLRYLIEHRERVVTKQELLEALWRGQHVDDFAVPWTVSHARRALGQESGAQQPIQTVRGRGYRFVAEVVEAAASSPVPQAPAPAGTGTEPDPFVGREALMEQLDARLVRAKQGHGAFCLLLGEAGIGKTRCMDELCARAEGLDFFVWTSRSVEASCGPVFWPWIQILRALLHDLPDMSEAGEAVIARLMTYPELADADASALTPHTLPMTSARFWQYEAVAGLLQAAARQRPVLLAFDDLHWADRGSWELLGFLAPELRRWPILIVGARREERGASARDPRATQARDAVRFKLASLGTSDVARYVELRTGSRPNQPLCEALREVSAGNPWFLRETVDALLAQHGLERLATLEAGTLQPAGAAVDRLRARIAALAPETRLVLQMASVLGDRFEIDLLSRMGERAVERVLAALEESRAEGLIAIDPPRRARFCHGLLRSVVYDDLAVGERLRFHLLAARALEQALDPLQYGEIAHHYQRALPLAEHGAAALAATRAAASAARAHAYADAALFLDWALQAQLNDPQAGPRARAELLVQRAISERLAGREAPARASASSLFELAREHGYRDLMLQAVRVLRPSFAFGCMPDPQALAVLEEIRAACPAEASEDRVSVLGLLSWIPPHALDMERSKALSAEAVTLARELASPSALQGALQARLYALSGPDDIDALLETANALLAVSGERARLIGLEARLASYRAHLYRCDMAAADASLTAFGREAEQQGLIEAVWFHDYFQAQRVFALGEFARCEALFAELAERSARLQLPQAPLLNAVASSLLTYEREGPAGLAKTGNIEGLLAGLSALPTVYAALGARLAAELGAHERARQMLQQLSQRDFEPVTRDLGYVNALANLSIASVALGDRVLTRALYERLAPYARHNTQSGVVGFWEGAAARFLANAAAFLGEDALAERHFEEALALNEQMGSNHKFAETCYEYARWLFHRKRKTAALVFSRRALELSQQLGMQAVARNAAALVEHANG
jgi:DNA-binding winged helix-turn-helix (wHTH) protein